MQPIPLNVFNRYFTLMQGAYFTATLHFDRQYEHQKLSQMNRNISTYFSKYNLLLSANVTEPNR